jgi:hypothetical protein
MERHMFLFSHIRNSWSDALVFGVGSVLFVPAVTQYPEKPVGWCHPIDFPICAIYTRLAWMFCFGCAHIVYRTKLILSGRKLSHRDYINIAIKHRCFILIHQESRKLSLICGFKASGSVVNIATTPSERAAGVPAVCEQFLKQIMTDLCCYLTVRQRNSGLFRA